MTDLNTDGLTGGSLPAVAYSTQLPSTSPITGIQFGTVQTEGYQMAFDDQFQSGEYIGKTTWTNTNMAWAVGDAQLTYDPLAHDIVVNRSSTQTFGGDAGGLDQPIDHPIFDSNQSTNPVGSVIGGASGGIATSICVTSEQGSVWAAARVTGISLTAPLTLQIMDTSTSPATIVAQQDFVCPPGKKSKLVLGYQLGSKVASGNPMYAQIVEYGAVTNDSWVVNQFSFFDESIFWEFSNDGGSTFTGAFNVRNNAYGILTFAKPGSTIQWRVTGYRTDLHINALRIRPIYSSVHNQPNRGVVIGPNNCIEDFAPDITNDPLFGININPILASWYALDSNYPLIPSDGQQQTNQLSNIYYSSTSESIALVSETAAVTYHHVGAYIESYPTTEVAAVLFKKYYPATENYPTTESAVVTYSGGAAGYQGLNPLAISTLDVGGGVIVTGTGPPTITSFSPTFGSISGGSVVTITGTNLGSTSSVLFGTVSASIVSNTATQLVVNSPAESAGTVQIKVTTPYGSVTSTGLFTYQSSFFLPPPGSPWISTLQVDMTRAGTSLSTLNSFPYSGAPGGTSGCLWESSQLTFITGQGAQITTQWSSAHSAWITMGFGTNVSYSIPIRVRVYDMVTTANITGHNKLSLLWCNPWIEEVDFNECAINTVGSWGESNTRVHNGSPANVINPIPAGVTQALNVINCYEVMLSDQTGTPTCTSIINGTTVGSSTIPSGDWTNMTNNPHWLGIQDELYSVGSGNQSAVDQRYILGYEIFQP